MGVHFSGCFGLEVWTYRPLLQDSTVCISAVPNHRCPFNSADGIQLKFSPTL